MEIKIKSVDIITDVIGTGPQFPKYTTQIMNLANRNSQGTRSKIVGQMSDLIQEFPGRTLEEWIVWHQNIKPNAIKDATDKVYEGVENLKKAINQIDKKLIEEWVKDLVFTKTFFGVKFQESVLKRISSAMNKPYRLATPKEESKGIDGFIGQIPVSIKPSTYKTMDALSENIEVKIIYYEKFKGGIKVSFEI